MDYGEFNCVNLRLHKFTFFLSLLFNDALTYSDYIASVMDGRAAPVER